MGQYHKVVNLTDREYLYPHDFGDGLKLMEFGQSGYGTSYALGLMLISDWKGKRVAIAGDYGEKGDIPEEALEGIQLGRSSNVYHVAEESPHLTDYSEYGNEEAGPDKIAYGTALTFKNVGKRARQMAYRTGLVTRPKEKKTGFERIWEINDDKTGTFVGNDVIVNFDTKQMITPAAFGDRKSVYDFAADYDGGVMTALVTLLASACKGGARGGGDIHSESELVGSWAGDHIAIVSEEEASDSFTDISTQMRELLTESNEGEYRILEDGVVQRNTWAEDNNREWRVI